MVSALRTALARREPGLYKYYAYWLAAAVVPFVPLPIARFLAWIAGLSLWALRPGTRRRVDANLRHIPTLAADDARRRRSVRRAFCNLALNYLNLFRVRRLSAERILADWTVENEALFEQALAGGRGAILICAHLGDMEYAAARLGVIGTPITLPVERLKPERLFALACELRSHHGIRAVPADSTESLRALFAALRRGEAVLLTVDRDVLGTGVEVPFFGSPARLPTGAVLLARRSGAPMLWAHGARERGGRSRGGFLPVDLPREEAPAGRRSSARARPCARAAGARGCARADRGHAGAAGRRRSRPVVSRLRPRLVRAHSPAERRPLRRRLGLSGVSLTSPAVRRSGGRVRDQPGEEPVADSRLSGTYNAQEGRGQPFAGRPERPEAGRRGDLRTKDIPCRRHAMKCRS
jgi:lauroyl/myristoyl acyltransferase